MGQVWLLLDGYLCLKKNQTFNIFDFVYVGPGYKRELVINISVRIAYLQPRTDGQLSNY